MCIGGIRIGNVTPFESDCIQKGQKNVGFGFSKKLTSGSQGKICSSRPVKQLAVE